MGVVVEAGRVEEVRGAVEVLDRVWRAEPGRGEADWDLDRLVGEVTGAGGVVSAGERELLLGVVTRAVAAGRAGSMAALRAFYLQSVLGVLSRAGSVMTPGGVVAAAGLGGVLPGRVDLGRKGVFDPVSGELSGLSGTAWEAGRVFPVFVSDVLAGRVEIEWAGLRHMVSFAVLGELVAHAPGRVAGMEAVLVPARVSRPVELTRSDLVRAVGNATGTTAWAPSRAVTLARSDDSPGGFAVIAHQKTPGVPAGRWIPGRPDAVVSPASDKGVLTTMTGLKIERSALTRYTLTTQGGTRAAGFDSFSHSELIAREDKGAYTTDASTTVRSTITAAGEETLRAQTLPAHDHDYYAGGHGTSDGQFGLWSQETLPTGTVKLRGHTVHGGQMGTLIKNDPAFAHTLTAHGSIHLRYCGTDEQHHLTTIDPLRTDRPTQYLATTTGTRVYRNTHDIATLGPTDNLPARTAELENDPTHPTAHYEEIWPLPTRDELDRLYALSGFNPTHTNRRHLRPYVRAWTRAIRHDPHLGTPAEGPP
ncbi:hypothetical protein, partial [Streptomyces zaomyceticus]|uniref:hypothetical protein n=1 Tax=Streptomyces zaomyceticus TaxID=68286 RepID=UPI0036CC5C44